MVRNRLGSPAGVSGCREESRAGFLMDRFRAFTFCALLQGRFCLSIIPFQLQWCHPQPEIQAFGSRRSHGISIYVARVAFPHTGIPDFITSALPPITENDSSEKALHKTGFSGKEQYF